MYWRVFFSSDSDTFAPPRAANPDWDEEMLMVVQVPDGAATRDRHSLKKREGQGGKPAGPARASGGPVIVWAEEPRGSC
jgi:hypothetical protein